MSLSRAAAPARVSITDQNVTHDVADPSNALATYTVANTGLVRNHVPATLETWLLTGAVADYEVSFTYNSGNIPTGSTLGAWLPLSSSRSLSLSQTVIGVKTCNITVEIREAVSPFEVLDTATINITAEVS